MDHDLDVSIESLMNDLEVSSNELSMFEYVYINRSEGVYNPTEHFALENRVLTARENIRVFVTDLLPPY